MMDGWAAAMVMQAALGPEQSASANEFAALADQLLDGLPEEQRRLFLILAVLPHFDERALAYLAGRPDVSHSLAAFTRRCPLIEHVSGPPPRLRYHPLLREHLLARLRRDTQAQDYRALLVSAADYLDKDDQFEEAAELYVEAADWPRLRDLVRRRHDALRDGHREAVMLRWLEAMPGDFVAPDPWLQYWFGLALTGDPPHALLRLDKAFEGFVLRADSAGALLCFCAAVTAVWASLDDLKPLSVWLGRRERIRRELPPCLNPEIRANATAARVVAMSIIAPWEPRLRHLARFGEYALRLLPVRQLQVIVGAPLAHYYAHSGQNAKLFALTSRVAPALDDETLPPLPRLHLQGMVGTAHFIRGDADAVAHFEKCFAIARKTGVHLVDNVVRAGIVMCLLNQGKLAQAEETIEDMRASTPAHRRFDIGFAHYLSAWLAASRGEAQLAIEHAQRAKLVFEQIGDVFGVNLGRSILVQVYADQDRLERAERELGEMRESIAQGCQDAIRHLCWLSEAWLRLRSRDVEAATEPLRAAFAIASAQQMVGQMGWRPDVATGLCALACERGIEVEYAARLVRHHQLAPPAHLPEAWPWPIKVYTLGRFALMRDDAPITFAGKAQKRPLDLLKVLVAFGGREVAQGYVAQVLWPEADGDAANASLHTVLKRLRELFGHPEAVTLTAGKLSVNPRLCWVDAWTFEQGLARAAGEIVGAERALTLYRGSFLDGEDESWSISMRERLRAKFLQGARAIGRELERREHWARAIEFYQRGLDVDDLAEEFYQQLMICHDRLGQRGEALSIYRRCKKSLAARLGVDPAEKTQKIHGRLLSS
jgi:DNA-binding SARP family transcriptional activator